MSLSDPNSKDPYNGGVRKATSFGDAAVPFAPTASPLSQIRGVAAKGSTGAGIPRHVTNVSSSIAKASTGATNAVTVTFSRDPADTSHSKVNVYVRGYQGNKSPVQIASGSESPVTFVVNNTGETISILVQAQGNAGAAPLDTAPSTGVQLPKSTSGGYGAETVVGVGVTGAPISGELAVFSGPSSITNGNLSGDVTTTNSAVATVVAIQGDAVDVQAPIVGDALRYSPHGGGKWLPAAPMPRLAQFLADGSTAVPLISGSGAGGVQTVSSAAAAGHAAGTIAGEPADITLTCAFPATTSVQASWRVGLNAGFTAAISFTLASVRRFLFRQRTNIASVAYRYWVGVTTSTTALSGTLFAADAPAANYAAFRFSSGTDTTWKAVTYGGSSQTVVDTGVAFNATVSTMFEIVPNAAGTSLTFRINGATVATIATNVFGADTCCVMFSTADNKNSTNAADMKIEFMYACAEYK